MDHSAPPTSAPAPTEAEVVVVGAEDWEEWDGQSPFWIHCVAGSLAGVVEHTAVYPLDTVKTNLQAICSACARQQQQQQMLQQNQQQNILHQHAKPRLRGAASAAAAKSGKLLTWMGQASASAASPSAAGSNAHAVGMWQTMRFLMNEPVAAVTAAANATTTTTTATRSEDAATMSRSHFSSHGFFRLWRGVQTMFIGCIPAHALHFSAYEMVKAAMTTTTMDKDGTPYAVVSPVGSSLAGAAAVLAHDCIMTPMDTVKQRMQLGHYSSHVTVALRQILAESKATTNGSNGGGAAAWKVLYRSFPITLATNLPYGMIVVTINEACKQYLTSTTTTTTTAHDSPLLASTQLTWQTIVISSSVAGLVASALTTPLDRIKTLLQTQELTPACFQNHPACPRALQEASKSQSFSPPSSTATLGGRRIPGRGGIRCTFPARLSPLPSTTHSPVAAPVVTLTSWQEAARHLYRTEGWAGFTRGMLPRVLQQTPAVAISWTTYETAKKALLHAYE